MKEIRLRSKSGLRPRTARALAPKSAPHSATGVDAELPGAGSEIGNFVIWQLADSAFPTGGFAHSSGLESAWQHGEVHDRAALVSFIKASLHQLSHATLPFVTAAHDGAESLEAIDRLCDAFTSNHVANRASRTQGRAFLAAMQRIFIEPDATGSVAGNFPLPVFAHFAPIFGAGLRRIGASREITARLFLFQHLRGILASAVRLNIVGPMEAQTLQRRLTPRLEELLARTASLRLEDIAQTSPLLDLWQGTQDRLYSRLFQS